MDNDLISRSAAMNTLSDVFGIPLDYDGECNEMCDEAFAAIEALPAVDAVPVVHARWYRHKGWHCSNCHQMAHDDAFCDPIFSKYCPNCGARMDGESEEER